MVPIVRTYGGGLRLQSFLFIGNVNNPWINESQVVSSTKVLADLSVISQPFCLSFLHSAQRIFQCFFGMPTQLDSVDV